MKKFLSIFSVLFFFSNVFSSSYNLSPQILESSNWEKNTQKEIKDKWENRIGQVWMSSDGKVFFAVGRHDSSRSGAEANARLLLVSRCRNVDVVDAGLIFSITLECKYSEERGQLVLVAIPTELLPKF